MKSEITNFGKRLREIRLKKANVAGRHRRQIGCSPELYWRA